VHGLRLSSLPYNVRMSTINGIPLNPYTRGGLPVMSTAWMTWTNYCVIWFLLPILDKVKENP